MSKKGKEAAKFRPKRPLSISEAGNIVDAMKELTEDDMREMTQERMDNTPGGVPINDASPESLKKFLNYAIGLIPDTDRFLKYKRTLQLRVLGYSYEKIAFSLRALGCGNVTPEDVKVAEKRGMEIAKETISYVKDTRIPLFEGA